MNKMNKNTILQTVVGLSLLSSVHAQEIESELDSEAILQKMEFDIADNKMIMSLMWKNE